MLGLSLIIFALLSVFPVFAAVPTSLCPDGTATSVAVHTAKQRDFLQLGMAERRAIGVVRADHRALTIADDPRWNGVPHAGTFPQCVTLSWSGTGPFDIEVRRADDNRVFYSASGLVTTTVDVFNFEIGCRYNWTVRNSSGVSATASFITDNVFPRLFWDHDPNGNIYGVRDLGGCYVSNGMYRVKQGLVFRSSKLNDNAASGSNTPGATFITDSNRPFWQNDLGIVCELDLRGGAGEAGSMSSSPISSTGHTVSYRHISGIDYTIDGSASSRTSIKNELDYALDPSHYPLVFHCSIGHDRTGTLAFLIHGLLGVSEDDMMRNYEASWFWYVKGTDSGVAGHYSGIDRLREALNAYTGETMADKTVSYCKNIGITDAQINAFRAAMLEPVSVADGKRWSGKTVSILGDSYSSWAGYQYVTNAYYPSAESGVTAESQMWWSRVIANYDGTLGLVVAGGGSRISEDRTDGTPVDSFLNRACHGELGNPDVIMVLGGLNDWWGHIPAADFATGCGALFDMLDANYGTAEKIVLIPKLPGQWNSGISSEYRSVLRTYAENHGYTVIDLEGTYNANNEISEGHPNALGMANIADRVIAALDGTYTPPAHVHVYGNWVTNSIPTAESVGERTKTCEADGCTYPLASIIEILPKLGPAPEPPEPDCFDHYSFGGNAYNKGSYFITDYIPDLAVTKIVMRFRMTNVETQSSGLLYAGGCSAGQADDGQEMSVTYYYPKNNRTPWISYAYGDVGGSELGFSDASQYHVITLDGATMKRDDVVTIAGDGSLLSGKASGPLVIGAMSAGANSFYNYAKMELSYVKVFEKSQGGETIVHDWFPGTNELGVAVLYDRVTKEFLEPVTSGATPSVGGGVIDPDPVRTAVAAAKSGDSVLPSGYSPEDAVLADDGASFAYGGRTYEKVHYAFRKTAGSLITEIAPAEARITGFSLDASGKTFVIGTVNPTVVGFRYAVRYSDELMAEEPWQNVTTPVSGTGGQLVLEAPQVTDGKRFYRLSVSD